MANEEATEATQETPNPEHPWVEASMVSAPAPTAISLRIEPYELGIPQPDGSTKAIECGMMMAITPVGVFNFFMTPQLLINLLEQGHDVLSQLATEQSGIVVANKEMQKEAEKHAKVSERLKTVK